MAPLHKRPSALLYCKEASIGLNAQQRAQPDCTMLWQQKLRWCWTPCLKTRCITWRPPGKPMQRPPINGNNTTQSKARKAIQAAQIEAKQSEAKSSNAKPSQAINARHTVLYCLGCKHSSSRQSEAKQSESTAKQNKAEQKQKHNQSESKDSDAPSNFTQQTKPNKKQTRLRKSTQTQRMPGSTPGRARRS